MSRPLTATALQAIFAAQTGEVFLVLLRLSHPDWSSDVRLVNNNVDITSNGDIYTAFPFELIFPDDDPEKLMQVAELQIDITDRNMLEIIRGATGKITAYVSLILASSPDDLLMDEWEFDGSNFNVPQGSNTMTTSLTTENIMNEPGAKFTFSPAEYPGLV